MRFKEGVMTSRVIGGRTIDMSSALLSGMAKVSYILDALGIYGVRATVTSILDGTHMKGSKHYEGKAFDLRTWEDSSGNQMPPADKQSLASEIAKNLGRDWDVVVEGDHIHIEYDPKEW